MGNGAKIGLVATLALIVAVVALWDRRNEEKHREAVRDLPGTPLERPADPPNRVKVATAEPAAQDRVSGEITHGPLSVAASGPRRPVSVPVPVPVPVPAGVARAPAPPTPKRYTIRASDTLSAVALAHYGDKRLWRRIYEANRDVIKNPDRPPVGGEITIPPLEVAEGGAREPQGTTVRPSLSMVDGVTTVPAGATGAESTGTRAGTHAGTGTGTYTVQPGDTLGAIAQKLLGSKTKWHVIYDLNRDKLPTENALRVGQQLVIPAGR